MFNVTFSLVGDNQGNYVVSTVDAISTIYEYVEPIAGIPQGNYEPIIQLIAPTKLQLAIVNGAYTPSEKTNIEFELAGSKNDLNLFSSIDDDNNDGYAAKLKINQSIIKTDSLWNLNALIDTDYINEDFRTIQRIYNAEFNRDWNLGLETGSQNITNFGNQLIFKSGLNLLHRDKGAASYQFEHLNYSDNFNGNRHLIGVNFNLNRWRIISNSSFLTATANETTSTFLRSYNQAVYSFNKAWAGTRIALESNEQIEKETDAFTPLSQRFQSYEVFTGIGDSTKIFAEIGYKYRTNDSIRNNTLQKVNTSNTIYLDSRIIQNNKTNLSLYANYRVLKDVDADKENEQSLNSRLIYGQRFFEQLIYWNTIFETNSGTLPQQDFIYVEVESGTGIYTWIDYNNNGIQELEEFDIYFGFQNFVYKIYLRIQISICFS